MADTEPTLDEWVATLKNSQLPAVITEGKTDYHVYRRFEARLAAQGVSFFPVGGRDVVLRLFKRRAEFSQIKSVFVIDRDLWTFTGTPAHYKHPCIIETEGYSVENDAYRDGDMESLLLPSERSVFSYRLESLLRWYAFAVNSTLSGSPKPINVSNHRVLGNGGELCPIYQAEIGFAEPSAKHLADLRAEYARLLRGKNLLDLVVALLNAPTRVIKHSRGSLLEQAAARPGPLLNRLESDIRAALQ